MNALCKPRRPSLCDFITLSTTPGLLNRFCTCIRAGSGLPQSRRCWILAAVPLHTMERAHALLVCDGSCAGGCQRDLQGPCPERYQEEARASIMDKHKADPMEIGARLIDADMVLFIYTSKGRDRW